MGVTLSNVYISLNGEVVQFYARESNVYRINSSYKIYKDQTKTPDTNIRIPISVLTRSIDGKSPYDILYEELKKLYPGSQDVIETPNDETSSDTVAPIGPVQVVMDENGAYIPTDKLVVEDEVPDIVAEQV
jgi:hypothetical protein